MVELLAPAGDFESLKAAVLNGADAVYIGGKEFSARQFAGNFDRDEIIEAVRFCHAYNCKVYVTVNTLLRNDELLSALNYASFLYGAGVDAIIIQDIGFLKLLRENLPEFEVHASTQMTAHSLDAVNLLYDMGVKRVVLSRELSLEEIKHITKNTKAEIEVFVHGALCISFSGQCLFSSLIGGRSGNRGRCAQPCRMEYILDDKHRAYHLSPKDLSTLTFINEIVSMGVASLKIEGRMKRPEYVAVVVDAYKKALEGRLTSRDVENVTQIFNRGGFTSAFLKGREGSDMMSYERPKNWGTYLGKVVKVSGKFVDILLDNELSVGDGIEIFGKEKGAPVTSIKVLGENVESAQKGDIAQVFLEGAQKGDVIYKSLDAKLISSALESFKGKDIKKIPIYGKFIAHLSSDTKLLVENKQGVIGEAVCEPPQVPLKTPTSRGKIEEYLNKTGDSPFYFENIDIDMDENIALSASKINFLRREAIKNLLDNLQNSKGTKNISIVLKSFDKKIFPKIAVKTGRADIVKASLDAGCDVVFFGGDNLRINSNDYDETLNIFKENDKVYPLYPEIIVENLDKIKENALKIKSFGVNKALCGNMGLYSFLSRNGFDVYLDRGFNIFNSSALDAFENAGGILSLELNLKQLKYLIEKTEKSTLVTVYGRSKLMVSRQCIIGSSMGHGKYKCPNICKNSIHYIKDRKGEKFPVITDYNCKSHIYNSKILCMIENMRDICRMNSDYIVLDFLDESYSDAYLTVSAFKEGIIKAEKNDFSLSPDMESLLYKLKGNITKGHFYRGVE
ncbi:putative protease [Caloramator quimbayensis]|uniref:Putative protease n=1 Tax=Caloramator quimbayensis TaxID=1147123 RepID=A0A1T4XHH7_9CLOT|nr:U32 family peptidase [Caloramator quimbayensis]SKA88966.1 putative protease [Caloramator quimbayensis]